MNIKRVILLAAAFLASFTIFFIFLFPYKTVLSRVLASCTEKYHIALSYEEMEAGPFGAILKGAVYSLPETDVELGGIHISYTPLSLITSKVFLSVENGFGSLFLLHKGSKITAESTLDVKRLAKLFGADAAALLTMKADYDYRAQTGGFTLSADKLEVNTGTGLKLTASNLKGEGTVKGNVAEIVELTAEGDAKLSLKGAIRIDTVNFMRTSLNLNGTGAFAGLTMNFTISGTLAAPKFAVGN